MTLNSWCIGDLQLLASELGLETSIDVEAVVDRFFPDDPLSDRARAVIVDLFDAEV